MGNWWPVIFFLSSPSGPLTSIIVEKFTKMYTKYSKNRYVHFILDRIIKYALNLNLVPLAYPYVSL